MFCEGPLNGKFGPGNQSRQQEDGWIWRAFEKRAVYQRWSTDHRWNVASARGLRRESVSNNSALWCRQPLWSWNLNPPPPHQAKCALLWLFVHFVPFVATFMKRTTLSPLNQLWNHSFVIVTALWRETGLNVAADSCFFAFLAQPQRPENPVLQNFEFPYLEKTATRKQPWERESAQSPANHRQSVWFCMSLCRTVFPLWLLFPWSEFFQDHFLIEFVSILFFL